MKQVLQNLKTGELEIAEVPVPVVRAGNILIRTSRTLISAGTERMLVNFAKSSLIAKAKQQPDKVKQVIDKVKTEGLLPTFHAVFNRLDEPLPLGYCNCGVVLEVGQGVEGFEVGDRVASNGPHAEIVCVPKNLCAKVPENVSDEQAAFTVLASIGLQGIRLIKPEFGETVVVFGLGLIGLLSAQVLISSGCKVIGIDIDKNKLALAEKFGARTIDPLADTVNAVNSLTYGKGADAVLITASAKNDSIIHQSPQMTRKRGRVVLVGVVNLDLKREDFYEKEITFQVSCSYGPGRYDSNYEQKGQDYPFGFVRWTERRNFEAVLDAFARGQLHVEDIISERISINEAEKAYKMLSDDSSKMALMLTYPQQNTEYTPTVKTPKEYIKIKATGTVTAALVGAGNFAKMTLLPAIKGLDLRLKTVVDLDGVKSVHTARKFGFEQSSNDFDAVLQDNEINLVFITTGHNTHSWMVKKALDAGKNVHVEKPLCLTQSELDELKNIYNNKSSGKLLHVGFNRRFSPHAVKIRELTKHRTAPMCMAWIVNAGHIPADVWIQDLEIGGGRIIGEGCHWLDFMLYLADAQITRISASMIGTSGGVEVRTDKMTITADFADGSIGTLHYFANGSKSFPKEIFHVFFDGKILELNNFRNLKGYGCASFKTFGQRKGHKEQFGLLVNTIRNGGRSLIDFSDIDNVTRATFAAMESAKCGKVITL